MPKARKRKKANAKRGWSRNKRLDDLYERLDLARSLPPEDAVRICKTIVNDSILDDDAALEDTTGVRPETFGVHLDALKTALDADADSPLYYGRPGRDADAGRRSRLQPAHRLLMYLESKKRGASQRYLANVHNPAILENITLPHNLQYLVVFHYATDLEFLDTIG